jgi:EAL domain-containing protein (putative c-di-GMP-specific phosphodiesterase class I)
VSQQDSPTATSPYTLRHRAGETPPPGVERRSGLARADMERIVAERHFGLAFQPIVRLSDRQTMYHEALLRPRPPQGIAKLPARVFVDLAAAWDMADALDLAVIDVALQAGAQAGGLSVSVNVAGTSLCSQDFIARVLERLDGNGAALLLEVTAATRITDFAALAAGIGAAQAAGVRVCLDDLGTAPETLDAVRAARFDQVKIDGASVRAAAAGERGRRLITALVALADAAGAETVAKMIETLPQAWLMHDLGVGYGQGWLFGPPGPLPGAAD